MPSRRTVLGGLLGSAGFSGCVMDRENASELALHFEPVDADALGDADLYRSDEWTPTQQQLLAAGATNETAAYGHRPFDDGDAIHVNGTYYDISVQENGTATVLRPVLRAEPVSESNGEVGNFSAVSELDQRALKCAVASADGKGPEPCILHAGNRSAFWPTLEFEYVTVGGDTHQLSATEQNVTLTRHDYRFTPVAQNRSAFATYAAQNLVAVNYDAMALTADQRKMLRTAAEEGVYRESPPYSEGLQELVNAFREGADDYEDTVRFDGEYYLASVQQIYDD